MLLLGGSGGKRNCAFKPHSNADIIMLIYILFVTVFLMHASLLTVDAILTGSNF